MLGAHKLQIVSRGVVFGETTVWGPHQATHGEVKARRTELPFIVTPGRKIVDFKISAAMFEHVRYGSVPLRIAATASLVGHPAGVAGAGQNQTLLDPPGLGFIFRQ